MCEYVCKCEYVCICVSMCVCVSMCEGKVQGGNFINPPYRTCLHGIP